jgi:hypothetical protein
MIILPRYAFHKEMKTMPLYLEQTFLDKNCDFWNVSITSELFPFPMKSHCVFLEQLDA